MSLFGALVRTAVNVATLPVAVAKDVLAVAQDGYTADETKRQLERIKREAETKPHA